MAETFGRTEQIGTYSTWLADYINGGKHTSGSAGSLASITADLQYYTAQANIKAAIYDASYNKVANGETEVKQVTSGWEGWMTFNFGATKPVVAAATDYCLVLWHDDGVNSRRDPNSNRCLYDAETYNGWPASLAPSLQNFIVCIYATYEEAPPPAEEDAIFFGHNF